MADGDGPRGDWVLLLEHHWPTLQVEGGCRFASMHIGDKGSENPCLSVPSTQMQPGKP